MTIFYLIYMYLSSSTCHCRLFSKLFKKISSDFKTPLGAIAISGLHGLPIALYCQHFSLMTPTVSNIITLFLTCGRILALRVEVRTV